MTALATPSDEAGTGPGADDAFADGATVLVGDPGDPVVFLAAAAPTIDAALGLRGGWSLRDRAATMRTAAAVGTDPGDLAVPGHVAPARIGARATPAAAAALELSRRAGRTTAVVLAPLGNRDGAPVTLADIDRDGNGALRGLVRASSTRLRARALGAAARGRTAQCTLPTRAGNFRAVALDGDVASECLALVHGDPAGRPDATVRVHVACTPGETLFATTCDCRARLDAALAEVVAAGDGVVLHVRPADGDPLRCARGAVVDLAPALALLQACGLDTASRLPTSLLDAS